MRRRGFLSASAGLIGLTAKSADPPLAGGFVNDAFPMGHRMRDGRPGFAQPKETRKVPIVIVGGGCAGLSAAWRLEKKGMRDFVLLEMESQIGGNARWGENDVSRYPWAAHYLPVANRESTLVRELCTELGLLQDGVWEERHLCHSPQERLFLHGRWQDGVEPEIASTRKDHDQYKRFDDRMKEFRATGVFTKPVEVGGAKASPLDRMSMRQWMVDNKFDSEYLNWYVNYSCRDDYGASLDTTSAWAGIHEFASREPEEKGPLTWPEGNGWIVERLRKRLAGYLRTSAAVFRVSREAGSGKWKVWTEQAAYLADSVIWAAPTFLASYLVEGAPKCTFTYSPWITANITLDRIPERAGDIAWDNVIYDSPSLGYVVATHMNVRTVQKQSVWTYYWALVDKPAAEYRKILLETPWEHWRDRILDDLSKAHRDIRSCVRRIDIMRLGHAMARPVPGFLESEERQRWIAGPQAGLYYANSDLSGFSIFEEAQYRGVRAADRAFRR
jgi:protoporphyrinogen oxidase